MKCASKLWKGTFLTVVAGVGGALGAYFVAERPAFAAEAREKPPADALQVANALSTAFEYSAQEVRPSVVSIQATKHMRPAAQYHWMVPSPNEGALPFGDQFLRRFFENQVPSQPFSQQGLGSGVIVDKDGYILTNNHVVDGADELQVKLHDGRELSAKVVGRDAATDLAVIKVQADHLRPAELGDSSNLHVGEWVLAVGDPFGLSDTITSGIVSAKGRSNVHIAQYEDFIQTDAAINPGNSGGPLVDLNGRVVGINTAIASRNGGNMGVGFAIPVDLAKTVMHSLIGKGHVTRGWLGVAIQPLNAGLAKSFKYDSTQGALVGDVENGSPAEKAGVKSGDIVTTFEGKPVAGPAELRNAVAAVDPGTQAELTVFRDGAPHKLTVKIGELNGQMLAAETGGHEMADELGMTVENLTPDQAKSLGYDKDVNGVVVTAVQPDGLAAEAGLQPNDVITSLQDHPVTNVAQFQAALAKHDLKDGVRMVVQSGNMKRFVFLEQRAG